MARARHVVVLALVTFAMIGLACGAAAPKISPSSDGGYDFEDDYSDDVIGTRPDGGSAAPTTNPVVAAPISGPVPPGAFDTKTSSNADSSSLHRVSAVAGAATAAFAAFFYF